MTETNYERAAREHRERMQASLAKATSAALTLRDDVREYLRTRLPEGFKMDVQDRKSEYGEGIQRTLVIVAPDATSYTLRFYAKQQEGYRRVTGYCAAVSGSEYSRNGRRYTPVFEPRKDGTYNLKVLWENVLTAIEQRRYENQVRDSRAKAEYESGQTFDAIGWQPSYAGARHATKDFGRFNVTINAGNISGGKVRVQVKLKDEYLTLEQVRELIERMEILK